MLPQVNDMKKNLMQLSWKTEGATEVDFNGEGKLKVDTEARADILKTFRDKSKI